MDWTKLEDLNIDLPTELFMVTMKGQLTGLRSLTFRPQWATGGTRRHYAFSTQKRKKCGMPTSHSSLPPLRNLSISGTGELLDMEPILLKHGHTLRSLAI